MTNQFMPPNKAIAAIANSGKEEAIDHSNPRHHPRPPLQATFDFDSAN